MPKPINNNNLTPQAARSRLQGSDYADYLLQLAKDQHRSNLLSGIENPTEQAEVIIFKCSATLQFFDTHTKRLRELTHGELKLIFKSPRQFHVHAPEGHYWVPAMLHAFLNIVTEGGNADGYTIDLFKGISFRHCKKSKDEVEEGEQPLNMIYFNPVEKGEPVTMVIKTPSQKTTKDLYTHLEQTTEMLYGKSK